MSWCKFYVQEWVNNKYESPNDGMNIIKFGITHHMDVNKRNDPSVDDGYAKNYDDWNIRTLFSRKYDTKEEALRFESMMLHEAYPANTHKVWMERYLNDCPNREYDNTGITELRLLDDSDRHELLQFLYNDLSAVERKFKREAQMAAYDAPENQIPF